MNRRGILLRGVLLVALVGLLAAAVASTSAAAPTVNKKKAKKIATKVSNNVFNQNIGDYASRVASGYTASPGSTTVATTSITAPAPGYLVLNGIVNLFAGNSTNGDTGSCTLELNNAAVGSSEYNFTVDDPDSDNETCASHHVASVTPGTYNIEFFIQGLAAGGSSSDGRVTALYVPLGGTGARP